jgi:hypothetical protein
MGRQPLPDEGGVENGRVPIRRSRIPFPQIAMELAHNPVSPQKLSRIQCDMPVRHQAAAKRVASQQGRSIFNPSTARSSSTMPLVCSHFKTPTRGDRFNVWISRAFGLHCIDAGRHGAAAWWLR